MEIDAKSFFMLVATLAVGGAVLLLVIYGALRNAKILS